MFVNSAKGAERMFRAEGKYPSRGAKFESAVTDIYKMNNWPTPMLFA